jgi:1-acyl-sn-glycerol-3-phosphate acyltransferase
LLQEEADDPPVEKPIPLQSKKRQLWLTIVLFIITFPFSGLLFYYLIQVLTENNPNVGPLLLLDPSATLLYVTVLSQTLVMLNHVLMNRVLDVLRWQLALRSKGVKAPIFFVLGSSISIFGALAILRIGGKTTIWSLHK